ncbi:MAG TPA: serine/threonine-protein kinase [Gemmatimonadales bacterium]|nr:serine/threonine-protein kinase [Gemmatimonadales bacterium]
MTRLTDAALDHLASVTDRPLVPGGRYEILDRLGQGGMGTVYLARDRVLGREVALKALSAPWALDQGARLLQEARILAALEHPGIVPVHDLGTLADGRDFYTMRRVQGRRLDDARAADPPVSDLLRVFHRVCETVAYAHANGILHRDLKPQNIMLGPFGEVLLMDWGVAKLLRGAPPPSGARPGPGAGPSPGEADTQPGTIVGTLGYMAPEQAAGEAARVDQRTDVYGLGAVLHFLLEGRAPAAGTGPRSGRSKAPAALRSIAGTATASAPEDRYASVADLMADLSRYAEGQPVRAHPEGPLRRAGRVLANHRVAVSLVLAYVLVRAVLLLSAGI